MVSEDLSPGTTDRRIEKDDKEEGHRRCRIKQITFGSVEQGSSGREKMVAR